MNMSTKKLTYDIFVKKSNHKHNFKYDYSLVEYQNDKIKVKIICLIHGVFEQRPDHHLKGFGCKYCGYWFNKNKQTKSTSTFIKQASDKHNNKYNYSLINYKNNHTKIKIICPVHGVFEQQPNNHLNGDGCKKCRNSKGETKIENFLIKNDVKYIKQYVFEHCKNINPLPFDFYLTDYNICIEYDGEQHFKPRWYDKNNDEFFNRQKRDNIKNKFCEENGVKLLRIGYKNFNNIDGIIERYLQVLPV